MKNLMLLSPLFALCLTAQTWAAQTAVDPSTPLSEAVAGKGSVVVLKAQTITGKMGDGTPAYMQLVSYQGDSKVVLSAGITDSQKTNLDQMSCLLTYNTAKTVNVIDVTPGIDATVASGTSLPWLTDSLDSVRFESFTQDGVSLQALTLVLYGDNSPLTNIRCTAPGGAGAATLTIKDFEDAMGGAMTLVPAKS
jgi:hypothetical protein